MRTRKILNLLSWQAEAFHCASFHNNNPPSVLFYIFPRISVMISFEKLAQLCFLNLFLIGG